MPSLTRTERSVDRIKPSLTRIWFVLTRTKAIPKGPKTIPDMSMPVRSGRSIRASGRQGAAKAWFGDKAGLTGARGGIIINPNYIRKNRDGKARGTGSGSGEPDADRRSPRVDAGRSGIGLSGDSGTGPK